MPPPFGKNCCGVAARVEHRQQPDFRPADDVKDAVRKTVEIQSAHIGKANGVEFRVAQEMTVMRKKIPGKL